LGDSDRVTLSGPTDPALGSSFEVLAFVDRPYRAGGATMLTSPDLRGYGLVHYACQGRVNGGSLPATTASLVVQPSSLFPELRRCLRSHSP